MYFCDSLHSMPKVSSQYYITEEDVTAKARRDIAVAPRLAELNDYVRVGIPKGGSGTCGSIDDIDAAIISQYDVVICVGNVGRATATRLNEICRGTPRPSLATELNENVRSQTTAFIECSVRGVAGRIFSDFGKGHVVSDGDGLQPHTLVVDGVS